MKYSDSYEDEDKQGTPMLTEDGKKQWRVNLQKRSRKEDKAIAAVDWEHSKPVRVCNGAMDDIDPRSIGNGSIANVRIYQYEYKDKDGKDSVGNVLMAVQVIKHVVYKPAPRDDDFEMAETETIVPIGDDTTTDKPSKKTGKPSTPSADDF